MMLLRKPQHNPFLQAAGRPRAMVNATKHTNTAQQLRTFAPHSPKATTFSHSQTTAEHQNAVFTQKNPLKRTTKRQTLPKAMNEGPTVTLQHCHAMRSSTQHTSPCQNVKICSSHPQGGALHSTFSFQEPISQSPKRDSTLNQPTVTQMKGQQVGK
jgi:hypothetical protein